MVALNQQVAWTKWGGGIPRRISGILILVTWVSLCRHYMTHYLALYTSHTHTHTHMGKDWVTILFTMLWTCTEQLPHVTGGAMIVLRVSAAIVSMSLKANTWVWSGADEFRQTRAKGKEGKKLPFFFFFLFCQMKVDMYKHICVWAWLFIWIKQCKSSC